MKPRIGVTSSPCLHEERMVESLDRAYVQGVVQAGGLPLVLPVLDPDEVAAVLSGLDGILLAGGGDIDPVFYADEASPEVKGVDRERDAYEMALARAAVGVGLPVLGICRGCQVLNVALGGTLVQHLPDVTDLQHCAKERWSEHVHTVSVLPGSRLRAVVGLDLVDVNTLHHQAVAEVGEGLRGVGWAEDGTVEAVEGLGSHRVFGVQWHPELLVAEAAHASLFEWLVKQAAGARTASEPPADMVPLDPVVA